nr:integrase, catalytic region, zinc finger, CCHC-type, peptidase aspartic, catalytic [Tanacetum cinerariifolium]
MVAYLKKPTGSEGFQEIVDFLNGSHIRYDLTKNLTIFVSLIKKFWQTATVRTVDNREQEITTTVDGKEFTVTEASVRRHLQLADAHGGSPRCQEAMGVPLLRLSLRRVESSSDENLDKEDPSKQRRSIIEETDQDERVTLVQIDVEDKGKISPTQVLADVARKNVHTYTRRRRTVSTGSGKISTASRLFSTAEELVSTVGASMPVSTIGMVQDVKIPSPVEVKDKAVRLQEELVEEERQRMARVHEAAQSFTDNETAKDLWDALERQMCDSEYGEQDRKDAILYEYETFIAIEEEQLLDTYLRYLQLINDLKKYGYKKDNCELNYKFFNNLQLDWKQYGTLMRQTNNLMDINIDSLYNILKQNQGDVNDAMGSKKKTVVVTSDTLALIAEKTNVSRSKEKVVVSLDYEGSEADDFTWMESSSDSDQEIKENMVFMAQIEKVLSNLEASSSSTNEKISEVSYYLSESESESEFETLEYYDNSTNYGLFVNNDDDQEIFHDTIESASENFIENHIDSQKDYDKSDVDHNDSGEKDHLVDKLIRKFNHTIAKCQKHVQKANQQSKDFKNQNKDLQDKYDVLKNQVNTFEEKNNEFNEQIKVLKEKNADLLAQTKVLKDQLQLKHDDYFQEIINPNFKKIDSPFQKTSSLKPYVSNVILEKIIIDLEDEVVNLLEKEKENLETIESLKSKGFESSENVISESENRSENKRLVVEKEYLLACNNSHLGETSSAYVCNVAMNVSCNHRMCDLLDDNNFFIFDDESVKISPVSKMPFRKKPYDSMNICFWIIDSGCSKHMTGNHALLTNFVEKFLETARFGNNDFTVIAGYGDVVIGSMTIKKVYYVKDLDTFSSVRRPNNSGVIWKKKESSNNFNVGESSHWQYKFPLPVEGVPTARRIEIPLPGVCTAMMKKMPVKDRWQLH